MNTSPPPPAIASRADFVAALRWGITTAIAAGARRIVAVDPTFEDWPLDDPALHDELTGWLKQPLRRLLLLASRYDDVPRRQPRFTAWRAVWAHAIEPYAPPEGDAFELPTALLGDVDASVVLFDRLQWRGRASCDGRDAQQLRDRVDALLQRSEPAFAVNRLGL